MTGQQSAHLDAADEATAPKQTLCDSPATVISDLNGLPDECPIHLPPAEMTRQRQQLSFNADVTAIGSAKAFRRFRPVLLASLLVFFLSAAHTASALAGLALDFAREGMHIDDRLGAIGVAGFAAQLVDGSLGMGYGLTSSSVLVASGLSPTTSSASVHLAQLGTTFISGVAHYRHGNVDVHTTKRVGAAGVVGAFAGALLLSSLPKQLAKPVSAGLLFSLGAYMFGRFLRSSSPMTAGKPSKLSFLAPLGLVGGFMDATGGGGWGPVVTCGLITDGRLPPRRVIGTVSASEFLVTVSAVAGFVFSLGFRTGGEAARLDMVVALLLGGCGAAPLAPYLTQRMQPQSLGVVVGGFICVTNARTLLAAGGASESLFYGCYAVLFLVWIAGMSRVASHAQRVTEP
jgi:uncharacterized membrane protein YfcA